MRHSIEAWAYGIAVPLAFVSAVAVLIVDGAQIIDPAVRPTATGILAWLFPSFAVLALALAWLRQRRMQRTIDYLRMRLREVKAWHE